MKDLVLLTQAIRRSLRKRRQYYYIAFFSLLLCGFSLTPILPPGIDEPTAIGPYLNGAFLQDASSGTGGNWVVENAYPNLTFTDPLAFIEIPNENSYYVVGKVGYIWQVTDNRNTTNKEVVLDISDQVIRGEDTGILNAVLHPEFGQGGSPNRGYIYVYYRHHPNGITRECDTDAFMRLSRFTRPDGSDTFDPNSELVLIQTYDEQCWHGGGGMFFDSDGFFYMTVGDAGGSGDYYNTAQKIDERLLSGVLRIDVDKDPSRSHPIRRQQKDPDYKSFDEYSFQQEYYIPNDNPWQSDDGSVLEEFYAIGLRSPHRASWDPVTGNIWIGDVGDGGREEISIADKGSNMQWPFMEGFSSGYSPPDPFIGVSTFPIYDYNHSIGNSIIGGMVYRDGIHQGTLYGQYIFGDHGARNVWSYNVDNGEVNFLVNLPDWGEGEKRGISSFATNSAGELFVMKLYGEDRDGGVIYRLKQENSTGELPRLLSETGAFSDLGSLTTIDGIVPYTVNAPLWSDGAQKKRWIALPNDGTHDSDEEQITFSETGNWQFPAGTVFIKHFELPVDYNNPDDVKRLETRFFILTDDGGGYGVTYKWNDEGTDAVLLEGGDTEEVTVSYPGGVNINQTWSFPSRTDCMTCHTGNADFVLGVNTWQLNGDLTYPSGITDNQLNTWRHLGMFANPFNSSDISNFLQSVNIKDNSATLEVRVRSYLDANCAHCHRPNGVDGAFDARFSTPLENQNIILVQGQSRNTPDNHYIVKPNTTSESELWIRDAKLGDKAMPPLAKSIVDQTYIDVLTDWINSLEDGSCEEDGDPCDDGDPCTTNDRYDANCGCAGTVTDTDGDTVPDGCDICPGSDDSLDANNDGIPDGCDECTQKAGQSCDDGDPCTTNDRYDANCGCVGTVTDTDGDTVPDGCDICPGSDDNLDANNDGIPDGCDECTQKAGQPCDDGDPCTTDDRYDANCGCAGTVTDTDGDTVPDGCDICPGSDDNLDANNDGIPDGCDECTQKAGQSCDDGDPCTTDDRYDANCGCAGTVTDTDGDTVPDGCDICPGSDDNLDANNDGIPDGCDDCTQKAGQPCDDGDPCTTNDRYDANCGCAGTVTDTDGDTVPDGCDICPGSDDNLDANNDGIPDGCDDCTQKAGQPCDDGDPCTTNDRYDANCGCAGTVTDTDGDTVPDGCDICPGSDDSLDANNDGIPDGCDECTQKAGQPCDDGDPCTTNDRYDANCGCAGTVTDTDGDTVPDGCDICPGSDDSLDANNDGIPDGCDECTQKAGQSCDDGDACTTNDRYDADCNCVGVFLDIDKDGVCDLEDQCPNADDKLDGDKDGIPDGCDICPGSNDQIDSDNDGVPDGCDQCEGGDDFSDSNQNGVPDHCDECWLQDGQPCDDGNDCTVNDQFDDNCNCAGTLSEIDTDNDGVPDECDECPNYDDFRDWDVNGIPDGCDTSGISMPMRYDPAIHIFRDSNLMKAVVEFKLEQKSLVDIMITNVAGQVIATPITATLLESGIHKLPIAESISAGIYYVHVRYEETIFRQKVVLTEGLSNTEDLAIFGDPQSNNKALKVHVRPNPFRDEFRLFIESPLPKMKRATIRIMDVNGRIIYQQYNVPFNEEVTFIPHSGWVKGVYIMHIHASDYSFTHTLVKQ